MRHAPSLLAWLSLLYSAVVGMVLANALWQRAVRALGSTQTLVYYYLEPVGAIALSVILLGEHVTAAQLLGAIITLAGVGLVRR